MPEFKCSCGELLVVLNKGVVRCWFCNEEYVFPHAVIVNVQYEEQESRPIIRTLDVHMAGLGRKKSGDVDI